MDLKDYLDAVKDGRFIVLAVLLLALVAGGVLAFTQTAQYRSTAKLYVATQVESKDPDLLSQRNAVAQQRVQSYAQVIQGDVLARQISKEIGGKVDTDNVTVSVLPGTAIIQVAVVDANPDRARDIAAAYAEAAPALIRELEQSDAGGWDVVVRVIDRPQAGAPTGVHSPLFLLILAALVGLGAGSALAALWWAVRRELAGEHVEAQA